MEALLGLKGSVARQLHLFHTKLIRSTLELKLSGMYLTRLGIRRSMSRTPLGPRTAVAAPSRFNFQTVRYYALEFNKYAQECARRIQQSGTAGG